jgi:hypothetical protein
MWSRDEQEEHDKSTAFWPRQQNSLLLAQRKGVILIFVKIAFYLPHPLGMAFMDKCWHYSNDERLCYAVVVGPERNMSTINPWDRSVVVAQSQIDEAWD